MGKWQYMVSCVSSEGSDAAGQVLDEWRANLREMGVWNDDEVHGWELVAEHYTESQDGTRASYRGTFKRPLQ
jgi:hypothetical protein